MTDSITVIEHVSYDRDDPTARGDFLIIVAPDKQTRCHITEHAERGWLVEHLLNDCTDMLAMESASTLWDAIDLARAVLNITT